VNDEGNEHEQQNSAVFRLRDYSIDRVAGGHSGNWGVTIDFDGGSKNSLVHAEHTTKTIWSNSSILSLLTPNPVHTQMQESCPLSIRQLVAATILGIWGHHWTQHFDDVAFDQIAATNNARSHIQRLCKQIQYRNKADFKTHDLIS